MADKPYFEERPAVMLRTWVLGQMMRGAGIAAFGLASILILMWFITWLGTLLPDASRETPAPMGWLTVAEAPAPA